MKRTILFSAMLVLVLTGCDQQQLTESTTTTPEVQPDEFNYLTDLPKTINGQAVTYFENQTFATDGKNIYINAYSPGSGWWDNYQLAKNIDAATFQLLDPKTDVFFKDKNGVYYNSFASDILNNNIQRITNVDIATARWVSYSCVTDKTAVFCDPMLPKKGTTRTMSTVQGADPDTFKHMGEFEKYFKDKNTVFCNDTQKGTLIKQLENVDVTTFTIVPDSLEAFSTDKNTVFHLCEPLLHSDPATFKILENTTYQKDKNNVYFEGWIMEGADPASFTIFNVFLAKDNRAVYQNGQKVPKIKDPASFVATDFSHGTDQFNAYEIVGWDAPRGLEVTVTPLNK